MKLIIGINDASKSKNILKMFAENGVGEDAEACKTVLKGIEDGRISFVVTDKTEATA